MTAPRNPEPTPIMLMVRQPGIGGSERQMSVIARSLDRKRFTPHVGCFQTDGLRRRELDEAGVPVVRFGVDSFKSPGVLSAAFALRRYIRSHGIRLVHSFDQPTGLFAIPVLKMMRSAVAVSSQRSHRELVSPRQLPLVRLTDKLARAVIVNSEQLRLHLIQDEGVPPERVLLCYNGIDLDIFHRGSGRRPELSEAELVIGVVCALRPEKDLATLLRAFAKVRKRRSGLRLAIVGDGPSRDSWRQLASGLELDPEQIFVPATSTVVPWLRSIDIFVLPSTSEALSNSLMEAMACGCTVVATRVGGNPELVTHELNGLLFEPGNVDDLVVCLERLIGDSDLRQALSERAQTFIHDKFSIAASVQRMSEIYDHLIPAR